MRFLQLFFKYLDYFRYWVSLIIKMKIVMIACCFQGVNSSLNYNYTWCQYVYWLPTKNYHFDFQYLHSNHLVNSFSTAFRCFYQYFLYQQWVLCFSTKSNFAARNYCTLDLSLWQIIGQNNELINVYFFWIF